MTRLSLLSLLLLSTPAAAAAPARAELAAFADEELPRLLEKHHLAGAVVSFVADGQVVFAQGYGERDRERHLPVEADRTLFRAGSVSKLFVWTAVIQCVEAGLVDLDSDVNRYLQGETIPATWPEPITLEHLMAHTPGFEDQMLGLFELRPERVLTLEAAIRHVPRRVAPPGKLVSYSNYGAALAARVVERVSGMPFDRYVDERILAPLGMTRSSFAQPLPPALAADLATGYEVRGSDLLPVGFEYVSGVYPAGSLSTTATDLARFLLVHLGHGAVDGRQILSPAIADLMHQRSFGLDPQFSGMAHGFMELPVAGGRMLYHGGDTMLFHTLAGFFPERDFGFFISTNTSTGSAAIFDFGTALLSRFFPEPPGRAVAKPAPDVAALGRFAGLYLVDRRSESDMARLLALGMVVHVGVEEGALSIRSMLRPKPERFVQTGRNRFQEEDGAEQVLFLEDGQGGVQSIMLGLMPVMTFSRPAVADQPLVAMIVVLAALTLLATGLVLPPTGLIPLVWKRFRVTGPPAVAAWVGRLLVATWVAWFVTMAAAFSGNIVELVVSSPAKTLAPFIPWAGFVLSLLVSWLAAQAWRRGDWGRFSRVHYSALALATLALFLWLAHWQAVA